MPTEDNEKIVNNIPVTEEIPYKLYRVTLRGMTYSSIGTAYGISYVVATDPTNAYDKVRSFLNKENIGFTKDRELDKIELIADSLRYSDISCMLFI